MTKKKTNTEISIIIITHNNQDHIEQAINSCHSSTSNSYEIIVVDNSSTDNSNKKILATLDKYNSKHLIVNNCQNLGPGYARNNGLMKAGGKYIAFLDGDDWFEPKAIDIMIKKTRSYNPDILLFNHFRAFHDKKIQNIPNRYTNLTLEDKNLSHPENRKEAIKNVHYAWNKIYKKEYLIEKNLLFPDGFYEDTVWSIKALTLANSIYYTGQALINYRQRNGSITRIQDYRHLQIFEKYQLILDFLKKNPSVAKLYGEEIYKYGNRQIEGALKSNQRIPGDLVSTYQQKLSEFIFKWEMYLEQLKHYD